MGEELIGAIADIFSILRAAKMDAILSDFQLKKSREDIVIRFYEDFLAAYKPQMRERRGVYYTPEPVVSYIVRSIDHILKTDFGLKDGLADATKVPVKNSKGKTEAHKVLITDIATGTGTFLHNVIDHIHQSLDLSPDDWSDYVSQHLLPRLLGFELLMAPYAVAHMKLGLQLAELGYKFDTPQRLRVYLTNTLQEAFQIPPADEFDNWIHDEADAANKIKQEAPVMVVMGNPPYSGHSANNGIWISSLLKGKDIIGSCVRCVLNY
jgi:predicted helicase